MARKALLVTIEARGPTPRRRREGRRKERIWSYFT
jgi:hypothetical protein